MMTDDEVIRAAMRLLGKRTSERKRESSRANAKRPRKRKRKPLANSMPFDANGPK